MVISLFTSFTDVLFSTRTAMEVGTVSVSYKSCSGGKQPTSVKEENTADMAIMVIETDHTISNYDQLFGCQTEVKCRSIICGIVRSI